MSIPMIDAKDSQCRYIIGDPKAMVCCGRRTKKDSSYCKDHHRKCYQETLPYDHYRHYAYIQAKNDAARQVDEKEVRIKVQSLLRRVTLEAQLPAMSVIVNVHNQDAQFVE